MARFTLRALAEIVASVAALAALPSRSPAQAVIDGDPYKTIVIATAPSSYWGYVYSPYGDLVRAQGDFLIKQQQAASLREDVRRKKLETHRLQLEHWEWEREFKVGFWTRDRERIRKAEVELSLNFPPQTEIFSAKALNSLFDELSKLREPPTAGSTRVEAEWLAHIHTTVDGHGNVGLLKDDRIFWPQMLLRSDFTEDRKQIEKLLEQAKKEVMISPTFLQSHPALLRELRERTTACQERVRNALRRGSNDPSYSEMHYVEAKRALRQLDEALVFLEKPDVVYYLNPLRGNTVAVLIANMKKEGVRFAAATNGCERFYVALHTALTDELRSLRSQARSLKSP